MAIPDYETLMRPVLEILAAEGAMNVARLYERIAQRLQLSSEDRALTLESGQPLLHSRVGWAKTYLKQAGLLCQPRRGMVEITTAGQELLRQETGPIGNEILERYPSFVDFRSRSRTGRRSPQVPQQPLPMNETLSPTDALENAVLAMRNQVKDELLEKVRAVEPEHFERIVIDLMLAMGYGGSRPEAGRRLGRSGDGGIDGVIDEDRLGLDAIYLQAKRWQGSVGRPEIQKFVGALQGVGAGKGVFLTTGSFTQEAVVYVDKLNIKVVLVDGDKLVDLMYDYGIGTTVMQTINLKRFDTDYFED